MFNWYEIILLLRDRFKPSINSVYAEEVRRYFLSIHVLGHILGSCVQNEFLLYLCVCVCVQSLSHFQFFVTPWTIACQTPLSMGFSKQARILKRVTISFSRGSSQIRAQTHVSCIGRQILYH